MTIKTTVSTTLSVLLAVSFMGMANARAEGAPGSAVEKASVEKTIQDLSIEQAHLSAIKEKLSALRVQKGLLTASDVSYVLLGGFAAVGTKTVTEKYFSAESKFKSIGGATANAFSIVAYGTVLTNLIDAGIDLKKVIVGDAEMQNIMSDIDSSQARIGELQGILAQVQTSK